jgi:chromosome segregation ATPase
VTEATLGERVAWLEAALAGAARERHALTRAISALQTRVDSLEESRSQAARVAELAAADPTVVAGVDAVLRGYVRCT